MGLFRYTQAKACGYLRKYQKNHNQRGMALVVTLLALVLITAMVVEFSYGVYTSTNSLYNWRDSQRLSVMAKSGITVSVRTLTDLLSRYTYSYPGSLELPIENPFEDFNGIISVRIEDENSKFNINSIISSNGLLNETAFNSFKRLLDLLSIEEKIAERVADWIDPDNEARIPDSEVNTKNTYLYSIDEILLINGIQREDYDKLLPYITVYGDGLININGAEKPVLRCMAEGITDELAQRVIDYRKFKPFEEVVDIYKVAGFETVIGQSLMGQITVGGKNFYIRSTASSGGIKRIIEAVFNMSGSSKLIRYWKEY
jgi:general secretion pathway protein K